MTQWQIKLIGGLLGLTAFLCIHKEGYGALEVVDLIYERNQDGSYIQVADYGISNIEKVFTGDGKEKRILSSPEVLEVGALVKVSLVAKTTDGSWAAQEVVVLRPNIPIDTETKFGSHVSARTDVFGDHLPGNKKQGEPQKGNGIVRLGALKLENGVWTN